MDTWGLRDVKEYESEPVDTLKDHQGQIRLHWGNIAVLVPLGRPGVHYKLSGLKDAANCAVLGRKGQLVRRAPRYCNDRKMGIGVEHVETAVMLGPLKLYAWYRQC
jgi:hypothetical protein